MKLICTNKFELSQNYPNPFNPSTTIKYTIPNVTLGLSSRAESRDEGSRVQLKVYDVLGNEVATLVNEYKSAGSYEVSFDASGLSSGIYFYKLRAGSFVEAKKMILVKITYKLETTTVRYIIYLKYHQACPFCQVIITIFLSILCYNLTRLLKCDLFLLQQCGYFLQFF